MENNKKDENANEISSSIKNSLNFSLYGEMLNKLLEEDAYNISQKDVLEIQEAIDAISSIDFEIFKFYAAEKIEVEGVNMFELLCKVRKCISRLETVEKDIKSYMVTELEKYPQNTFIGFNHRFSLVETGVVYEYKVSEEWNKINEMKKELENRLKKHVPKRSTTTVRVEYFKP